MKNKILVLKAVFAALYVDGQSGKRDTTEAVETIEVALLANNKAKDTLYALYEKGPLKDGDVPSKSERDWLLDQELAVQVIANKEDGYQACTYKGRDAVKVLKVMQEYDTTITYEDVMAHVLMRL